MTLLSTLIRKHQEMKFATATPATVATQTEKKPPTVASVATVAVANTNTDGFFATHADITETIEEAIEERAAIMEHDGGLPREQAEAQARSAMRVYEYQLTDSPRWLIVIRPGCDLAKAEHSLREKFGEKFVAVRDR